MADLARITDYPSLLANVEAYLARDDLQAFAPTFIQMAEDRFNTDLKVVDMHKATGDVTVVDDGVDKPADFIDWVAVRWKPVAGSLQRPLYLAYRESDSPEFRNRHRPTGVPQFYTVLAGRVVLAPPIPGTVNLTYYARLPALTAAAPTNWLITKAPMIYLYGTLLEAMLFQKDEDRAAQWFGLLDKRLAAVFGSGDTQKTAQRTGRAAVDAAEVTAAKSTN